MRDVGQEGTQASPLPACPTKSFSEAAWLRERCKPWPPHRAKQKLSTSKLSSPPGESSQPEVRDEPLSCVQQPMLAAAKNLEERILPDMWQPPANSPWPDTPWACTVSFQHDSIPLRPLGQACSYIHLELLYLRIGRRYNYNRNPQRGSKKCLTVNEFLLDMCGPPHPGGKAFCLAVLAWKLEGSPWVKVNKNLPSSLVAVPFTGTFSKVPYRCNNFPRLRQQNPGRTMRQRTNDFEILTVARGSPSNPTSRL